MAQPFCTGPALLYVGVGPGRAPVFLGTTEHTPRIIKRKNYKPLFNDLAGQMIPYDKSFQGEDCLVISELTRLNWPVYNRITCAPDAFGGVPGMNFPGDMGTLMMTEGGSYFLWVVFPYAAKPAFATMSPGYRFFSAFLEDADTLAEVGTNPVKVMVAWYCGRVIVPVTTGVSGTLISPAPQTATLTAAASLPALSGAGAAIGGAGRAGLAGAASAGGGGVAITLATAPAFVCYDFNVSGLPSPN